MRVTIKRDDCIGCELCVRRCPEVFKLDEEKISSVILDPIPPKLQDIVKGIANSCPTNAINLEE